MPRELINQEVAIGAVASEVSHVTGVPKLFLLENLKHLDELLKKCESISWEKIGRSIGQSRQQIYRWYHDTHQRKLCGCVKSQDVCIIRGEIDAAIEQNGKLDLDLQRLIKEKLSQTYHRNAFTIAFNNQKRLAIQKAQSRKGKLIQFLKQAPAQNAEGKMQDFFEANEFFFEPL